MVIKTANSIWLISLPPALKYSFVKNNLSELSRVLVKLPSPISGKLEEVVQLKFRNI